jgi:hypothetical protein
MILHLVASVFLLGFALLLSILHLMRCLYACGICEPPSLSADPMESEETVTLAPHAEST